MQHTLLILTSFIINSLHHRGFLTHYLHHNLKIPDDIIHDETVYDI